MSGAQIADLVFEAEGLIGPAHAFTPWTGMYAYHRSLSECYQEKADRIRFIELGLSADSDYADRIAELSDKTFLSNSDAHSPRTNKLAREFNQMEWRGAATGTLAICREKGRDRRHAGFQEGKYNRTACTRCLILQRKEMNDLGTLLPLPGQIKLVADRVDLLADYEGPQHPSHGPLTSLLWQRSRLALGYKSR